MKLWVLIGACVAAPALGAPVAVECSLTGFRETETFGEPKERVESAHTETIVIDDDLKTIKQYDDKTVSLNEICKECDWTFGVKSIGYIMIEGKPNFRLRSYKLDRVNATLEHRHSQISNHSSYKFEYSGPCRKVPVPSLKVPEAKF